MSATLAPTALRIRLPTAGPALRRHAHGHADYQHIPFSYANKTAFAAKCVAYLGLGFSLPFVALGWQWYKPGGFKNP
ncbi:unnamed protein product [Mycena citricolor]|uniref:Cytochrome c oxidase subunit 8, mitochondrial n=1 Tax=Mycena citricolor TaxID=2018698 RepID=A0AAD2K4K5_9AGAR|nr:unnamed protein product [Mycena citricolor]